MKLEILESITLQSGESPWISTTWKNKSHGLFDVTWTPDTPKGEIEKQERSLVFWRTDQLNENEVVFGMPFPIESIENDSLQSKAIQYEGQNPTINTGIDGNVLLKAIAIAQNPELSLKLLNQQP